MTTVVRNKKAISKVAKSVTVSQLSLPKVTLPTYDLKKGEWVLGLSTYQNNLANALHGLADIFMLDLSGWDMSKTHEQKAAVSALESLSSDIGYLDGATGCRKKGLLIGHKKDTDGIIGRYLSGSKKISHGSILFSECRQMFSLNDCTYTVMPDNTSGLGDCHGMITMSLYNQLVSNGNQHQIQYRFGVLDKWIAKGTLLPYPDELLGGNDIIFPESSFKGSCPKLNKQQVDDAVFGILHLSKTNSKVKTSHQVIGNFTSDNAKQYILDCAKKEMLDILAIRSDINKVLEKFIESMGNNNKPDALTTDYLLESNQIDLDSEDEEVLKYWRYAKILKADIWGQLKSHPATVQFINQRLQRMISDIALGKFFKATGLMASPCNSLRHGYVITSELKTGCYLYWRYPVRHYGDIRKVEVINPLTHPERLSEGLTSTANPNQFYQLNFQRQLTGVFFINPDWFLEVNGDHDGDVACFLSAHQHIPLLDEVESWEPLPIIQKAEKKSSKDSLPVVAVKAMSNRIGLFAWLMAACRQLGWTHHFPYLGEQINLEVDSFKSDLRVDNKFIDQLKEDVGNSLSDTSWLLFYKKDWLYLNRTAYDVVNNDIIAELINQTSDLWDNPPEQFTPTGESLFTANPYWSYGNLFNSVDVPKEALAWASKLYSKANAQLKQARSKYPSKDLTSQQEKSLKDDLKAVNQHWIDFADGHRNKHPEKMLTMAAAFHKVSHSKPNNEDSNPYKTCLLVFKMFYQEYITILQDFQGITFKLWRNSDQAPSDYGDKFWQGEILVAQCQLRMTNDHKGNASLQPYLVSRDGKTIARVSTDCNNRKMAIPPTGTWFPVKLTSVKGKKGLPIGYHVADILIGSSVEDMIDF